MITIQIRIVIRVPRADEVRFPETIEKIRDFVLAMFPQFKAAPSMDSPVIVTIEKTKSKEWDIFNHKHDTEP
jgi:hypothetical protein